MRITHAARGLVALILFVAISGCTVGSGSTGGSVSGDGTVDFPNWVWGTPDNAPFWKALKADFDAENPDLRLTDEVVPGGEYQDKMFTLLSAGNPPDLVTPFDPQMRAWADAGLLEPLDPWLEKAGYDLDSFIPPNQMAKGKDGKIYGVIYVSNPRVLFVNRGLLQKYGLQPPTTPEELYTMAKTLRDKSAQQFGFATMSASAAAFPTYGELAPIVKSFGGDFVKDGKATATSPQTVEALRYIEKLHAEGLIPAGQTEVEYREGFAQGKVASIVCGAFVMSIVKSKNPTKFGDYDAVPMPFGSPRTTAANGFLAIPKKATDKEAAAKVILKVLETEWQQKLIETSWQVPARPDMIPAGFLDANPWFRTMIEAVPQAESLAPVGNESDAPKIQDAVTRNYQQMLLSNRPAADAAAALQTDLTSILTES
ncbi:ABC transporter substrate-binding protein [Plantactinospora sp. GCM10030261]|uniref:ABC transporter substrate-binding protein n=1 Tax=Plantactinospora sp. GCM10030261 TaxID=3273420 RepID=UPI0036227107